MVIIKQKNWVSGYDKDVILPKEVLVPSIVDIDLISDYLNTKVLSPSKGIKKSVIDMANNNAKILLEEKFDLIKKDEEKKY